MSLRKPLLFLLVIAMLMSCASATPYKSVTYTGKGIPSVTNSDFIVNMWLVDGNAPMNNLGEEIILSNFSYVGTNRTDGWTAEP